MASRRSPRAKSSRRPERASPQSPAPSSTRTTPARHIWWLLPALLLATLVAYQPAWHGGILWDDAAHITRPELQSLDGLRRIWFDLGATQQYYPVSYSAFWVMHRLWGDDTLGYHLVNIALHSTSAFLFALLLWRLGARGAVLAAFIFALHPVQVESVAWMTELKNTLSGTVYLLAAWVYLDFDERRAWGSYVAALGLFVVAVLSKTVAVTLPAALLVIFWWRRGRLQWRADIAPLVPFFGVAAALGLLVAWVERTYAGAEGTTFQLTIVDRILIAGRAIWFYLATLAWPANLTFIYPRWPIDHGVWWQYLYPLGVLAVVAGLWQLRGRSRAPLAAFLLFCGTLFPALGFFNVFAFEFSFVADHFQYLATFSMIALAAAGLTLLAERLPIDRRSSLISVTVLVSVPLGVLTWSQSRQYRDADTLYRETLARNPACWLCENNLGGNALGRSSDASDETMAHFTRTLALNPGYAPAYNNLGIGWRRRGQSDRALQAFREAVRLQPGFAQARYNLGLELFERRQYDEAMEHLRAYITIGADDSLKTMSRIMIGRCLVSKGRTDEALTLLRQVVADQPGNAAAEHSLALTLVAANREPDAIEPFARAAELEPGNAAYRQDLGNALAGSGRMDEAIASYRRGVELAPTNVSLRNALGIALAASGRGAEAMEQFRQSLAIDPGNQQTPIDREAALQLLAAAKRPH